MSIVAFRVDGVPRGKQRPAFDSRKQGKRGFTRAQTRSYEDEVQKAWQAVGRVDLGDGPLGGVVTAVHRRPRDHYTATGALSAKGLRMPLPICKPDADNVLKIVLDALHCPVKLGRLAFSDDTQVVRVRFERRWAIGGELAHTDVRLWNITTVADPAAQAAALLDAVAEHTHSSVVDLGDGCLRVTDDGRAHGRSLTIAPDGTVTVDFPAMT